MMGPNGRSRIASASHTVVLVGGFDRAAGEGVEAKEKCAVGGGVVVHGGRIRRDGLEGVSLTSAPS